MTTSRGQFGAYRVENGNRILSQHGLATSIAASPVLDKNIVFGYGSESPAPFGSRLSRYDTDKNGQLSPDEYGNDAFMHGIGKFFGNRDLIVTKEEWDEKQREVTGRNRLAAVKLERDPNSPKDTSVRLREVWRYDKNFTGVIPSPIVYKGLLYILKNGGILSTFDTQTGTALRTARIDGALGGYSASPVASDGKLILASEDGKLAVLRAGADWTVLAISDLGESCYATPALSGGHVYLRTGEALYRFGSVSQAHQSR